MEIATALGTGKTAVKAGKVIAQASKDFLKELEPYKPSVKSMSIDYQSRACEYKVLLLIPDELRRKITTVKLPGGYTIHELYDDSFTKIDLPWELKDGRYKIRASKFPASEKYFACLKGNIDAKLLASIIRLSVASTPKKEDTFDKYWIQTMIRDVSILERIWDELNIEKVDCKVKVGVDRCFSTNIPDEFKERVKASQDLLAAYDSGNSTKISLAQWKYRKMSKKAKGGTQNLLEIIRKLIDPTHFQEYVKVDQPFNVGNITPAQLFRNLLPQIMGINVFTTLNYKIPAANGDLVFNRGKYDNQIKRSMKKLVK